MAKKSKRDSGSSAVKCDKCGAEEKSGIRDTKHRKCKHRSDKGGGGTWR